MIKIKKEELNLVTTFIQDKKISLSPSEDGYEIIFEDITEQEIFEFGKTCAMLEKNNKVKMTSTSKKFIRIPLIVYILIGSMILLYCLFSISTTAYNKFNEIKKDNHYVTKEHSNNNNSRGDF